MKIVLNRRKMFAFWGYVFLTIPLINPPYVNQIRSLDLVFNLWKLVAILIICGIHICRHHRIPKITVIIVAMQGYITIDTIMHKADIYLCIVEVITIIAVIFLYNLAEVNTQVFLSAILFSFEIVIFINLLTEILYPDTLYVTEINKRLNFFLGYYNNHTAYFIPALLIGFLYMYVTGKKLRICFLTIEIVFSAILVRAGGVIVVLLIMGFVFLFFKDYTKIFNYFSYWGVPVFLFVVTIIMKMQEHFRWLIDNVLHKWNSLSARIVLWYMAVEGDLKSPIWGYGIQSAKQQSIFYGKHWMVHAHNQLLQLLHEGGIIYLALFVLIIIIAGIEAYKKKCLWSIKVISIAFLGWSVHSFVEPMMHPFLIGLFVLVYYSECFEKLHKGLVEQG